MHTFFTTLLSNLLFAVRSSRSGKDIKESTLETQADAQLDWPTGLLRWELISESPNQVGVELVRFARRTGHEIEVIFIDLDCFGEVNKKLGHDTGDRILSHLGTAVKGNLRAMDLAFQKGDQTLIISVGSGHVHTLMGRVQTAYATLVDSDSVLAALRGIVHRENHLVRLTYAVEWFKSFDAKNAPE
jgi:diguanylate cyclase (GGDEF)-like protein